MIQDQKVADLNKEATAAKREGDLRTAVRLLREAKRLQGATYQETRLAKFLQAAGQIDEAMKEIKWLIDHSHAWSEALFGHQPRSVRRRQQASWISRIHRDAVLIAKRAQRRDLQLVHEAEAARWVEIKDKLEIRADRDEAARRQAWEVAKSKGSAAMTEFLEKKQNGTLD